MIPVRNPWTGQIDFEFEEPTSDFLAGECARLRKGQKIWMGWNVDTRILALQAFARSLRKHQQAIIEHLQEDTGRVRIAALEFDLTMAALERACRLGPDVLQDSPPLDTGQDTISARQQKVPYGLALNIAPWNFPLLLSLLDVFPALIAGNAAIIKPSEVTPRWVGAVQAALNEVPELAAVLGIAVGTGVTGAKLIDLVDVLTFTGSVATGRKVAEAAASNFIPAYLELGGNDPAIVLSSADVDFAAEKILWSCTTASGQACQSLERVYVDSKIAGTFVEKISDLARDITINYPEKEDGVIGPFIFDRQADIVADHLTDAVAKGARIQTGGIIIDHGGKWLEATVLIDVNHQMKIMTEETFGPVIPIQSFSSESEAIELANDTTYGLSASVFAGTADEGNRIARHLEAGAVSINDASLTSRVHGIEHESFHLSGMGRSRFGAEGIARYTRTKAIFENDPDR
jgi:acyl-CoA reductase-like NAD-dependent aldehyde dehydrogenase